MNEAHVFYMHFKQSSKQTINQRNVTKIIICQPHQSPDMKTVYTTRALIDNATSQKFTFATKQ